MVEESISIYSYRLDRLWGIGMSARAILDGHSLNLVECDDYGSGI